MSPTVFAKINEQLGIALAKRKINKEFLLACEEGIKEFTHLKEESKKYQEILISLKLFSAARSGEMVLEGCVSELKNAKKCGDNPVTLTEMSSLIVEVCDLGEEVKVAMEQHDVNRRLRPIRKRTFRVQEGAEKNNLIESIDVRLSKVPTEIRKTFIKHSMQPLESA